jgi:hypothetical protein
MAERCSELDKEVIALETALDILLKMIRKRNKAI